MRASQRGNALFRAGTQPLRQPRATTSRHPPLEIEPSRRVAQRRKTSVRECARTIAELTERRLASAQADTFENHQRSRASLAMASGAISEQEQGEFLMASGAIAEQQVGVRTSLRRPPALKIKIQRKVAQHGGIGKMESGGGAEAEAE